MTVSCIIPTYQNFEYLKEALDSVMIQTYPDIELIVADDASDNITEKDIRDYVEYNKGSNITNYKILKHDKNIGTVRNMNSAVLVSTGDIIIPLAFDDKFASKDVISLIVERFQKTNCNILVCSRLKCSHDMKTKYRLMPHPRYVKYIEKYMNTSNAQFVHMALGAIMEFASGSSMYYSKSFFYKMGGYDERYSLWEDGPFIAKVTREGYKIETAYDIVAILYRGGGISSKRSKDKVPSKIEKDYCNAILYEYLKYPDRFSKKQVRILKGRYELQKLNGNMSMKYIIMYPESLLCALHIKFKKIMYKYILGQQKNTL